MKRVSQEKILWDFLVVMKAQDYIYMYTKW